MQDIPPSANCEPELRTVHVAPLVTNSLTRQLSSSVSSQSDIYFPHCIRLPVCGGCCPSERLRCTPTIVAKQNVSVLHMRYSMQNRRFQLGGVERVQVERHNRCQCQCITQPSDCGPEQLYQADECRCICPDTVKMACLKRQRKMSNLPSRFILWNGARCKCECNPPGGVWRCATGFKFDRTTCRYMCDSLQSKMMSNYNNIS